MLESMKVTIETDKFSFDGYIHFAQLGKVQRRLSNLLNSEKHFIALTDVTITNRETEKTDNVIHPFIHIRVGAIQFIKPYNEPPLDEETIEALQ